MNRLGEDILSSSKVPIHKTSSSNGVMSWPRVRPNRCKSNFSKWKIKRGTIYEIARGFYSARLQGQGIL